MAIGYEVFDRFIERLKSQGLETTSENLDQLLHKTAWTTSSEMMGELGLEILRIQKSHGKLFTPETRNSFTICLNLVRKTLPGFET